MFYLDTADALAIAVTEAIHSGDTGTLTQLLSAHPGLSTVRLGDPGGMSRTVLHVATDWPGHYPNCPYRRDPGRGGCGRERRIRGSAQ